MQTACLQSAARFVAARAQHARGGAGGGGGGGGPGGASGAGSGPEHFGWVVLVCATLAALWLVVSEGYACLFSERQGSASGVSEKPQTSASTMAGGERMFSGESTANEGAKGVTAGKVSNILSALLCEGMHACTCVPCTMMLPTNDVSDKAHTPSRTALKVCLWLASKGACCNGAHCALSKHSGKVCRCERLQSVPSSSALCGY